MGGAQGRRRACGADLRRRTTASLAGGLQFVARVIETGLHRWTRSASTCAGPERHGTAPLAPTARTDIRAIGRTNDCILYGVGPLYRAGEDDELAQLATRLPASASSDYGTPVFYDIF